MEVRINYKDSVTKFEFGPSAAALDGIIALGADRGILDISLPYAQTAQIDFKDGIYDLFMKKTDLTDRKRIMKGYIVTDLATTT